MRNSAFALATACVVFAAPAFAQDNEGWDRIVLEAASGSVMTSTGGEYQSASAGKELVVGESMMLGASSKARVVYYDLDSEGKVVKKCVKDYSQPNTYVIDATCTAAAAWANGGVGSGKAAAIIAGAAVIGAAILENEDKVDVGPLSPGIRHL